MADSPLRGPSGEAGPPPDPPSAKPRAGPVRIAWFVVSAAAAAALLRFAWSEPVAAAIGVAVVALVFAVRWLSRRRVKRLLHSGDVESVLARWAQSLDRVPHAGTMGPLMAATAFAAYGWVGRAREVLRAAERGPAWEAALEHRLFLDTILLTFEGEVDAALAQAERLRTLPMPSSMPFLAERVRMLRGAVAALARAFAHCGQVGDRQLLITASDASPLVHWAMRYAAAISALDDGDLGGVRTLLEDAPHWPAESRFRGFHHEIVLELERQAELRIRPAAEVAAASHNASHGERAPLESAPPSAPRQHVAPVDAPVEVGAPPPLTSAAADPADEHGGEPHAGASAPFVGAPSAEHPPDAPSGGDASALLPAHRETPQTVVIREGD